MGTSDRYELSGPRGSVFHFEHTTFPSEFKANSTTPDFSHPESVKRPRTQSSTDSIFYSGPSFELFPEPPDHFNQTSVKRPLPRLMQHRAPSFRTTTSAPTSQAPVPIAQAPRTTSNSPPAPESTATLNPDPPLMPTAPHPAPIHPSSAPAPTPDPVLNFLSTPYVKPTVPHPHLHRNSSSHLNMYSKLTSNSSITTWKQSTQGTRTLQTHLSTQQHHNATTPGFS